MHDLRDVHFRTVTFELLDDRGADVEHLLLLTAGQLLDFIEERLA